MRPKIHRLLRRLALALVVAIAILAVVLTAVLVFKPTLNLSAFKSVFEAPLTAFMETPVTVEKVLVRPGSWTLIQLMGVSIEAAGQGAGTEFAHADRVTLDLAVMPLLDNQVRLRELGLDRVNVDVRKHDDGTGNWPVWTEFTYEIAELDRISVTDVSIAYSDEADGRRHRISIDIFESEVSDVSPLQIVLDGSIDQTPLSVRSVGPTFSEIQTQRTWPLDLTLSTTGSQAELKGTISGTKTAPVFDMAFTARSSELAELAAAVGVDSPAIGSMDLEGAFVASDARFSLTRVTGRIGDAEIEANLELDISGQFPAVKGRIDVGRLDVSPWFGRGESPAGSREGTAPGLDALLPVLRSANASLGISVNELVLPDGELEDIEVELELQEGVLTVPLNFQFQDQHAQGRLIVDEVDAQPHFALDLGAQHTDLGVFGREEVGGWVRRLSLESESRGTALSELVENLGFQVRAQGLAAMVGDTGSKGFEIPIQSVVVVQKPGTGIWASMRGLHGDEELAIELGTASLIRLLDSGEVPVYLSARGGGATAILRGRVRPHSQGLAGDLRYSLEGDAVGDLSPLIGVSPDADMAYRVQGRFDATQGRPHLVIEDGRIGRTTVTADLRLSDHRNGHPIEGRIDVPEIDLGELASLRPSEDGDTARSTFSIHDQIVPRNTRIPDIDVEIAVGRVVYDGWDLATITASLHARGGHLESSPFAFEWEELPIEGALQLDLRSGVPEADIFAFTEHIDVHEAAHRIDLGSLPQTTVGRVNLELELRGATLDEINRDSYASITVDDLRAIVHGDHAGEGWEIVIDRMQADALYGEPTRATATGSVNHTPIEMTIGFTFDELASVLGEGTPVEIGLVTGETLLGLSGLLALPFDTKNLDVHVLLSGTRLDDLNSILNTDLPSVGPYSIDGRLLTAERNIDLSDLDLVVGDSLFRGEIGYFEGEHRPIIVGRLASHRPRIEDFYPAEDDPAATGAGETQAMRGSDDGTESVIDPEMLRAIDADLSLDVTGLEWGDRGPGSGEFRFRLDDGHLAASVRWDQPQGGYINAQMDLKVDGNTFDVVLNADIDHMSYGPLRPLLAFEGGEGGVLSLDTQLRGKGSTFEEWVLSSEGHLDFTTYPESHHAAIFNLWGGQLIDTLLPIFGAEKVQTTLNCTVGELDLSNGLITPRSLVLDASRTRVRGKGVIDLNQNTIDLKLSPRPKRRGFLSLATPINIEGPLDDPTISVNTGGLAVTALRVSSWVVTVWFELLKKPLPADGADICVDPPSRAVVEREASEE